MREPDGGKPQSSGSNMIVDTDKPTISDAEKLLKQRFGHTEFRPGQRQVIQQLLSPTENGPHGRALAIFPTGAGKSLCYQLPAILFQGLTLVVSPLMALMKDQVDSLVQKGFSAACLDSSLSATETRDLFDRLSSNDIKILFVSPERFKNTRFLTLVQKIRISLFAIDEAHCISEWGHSFRPDYLRLSRWADRLKVSRRLALTATATPQVARDICESLSIPFPDGQVRLSSYRPNLTIRVTTVASSCESIAYVNLEQVLASRVDLLVERLRQRDPGPCIVYVTLQASADFVASRLRQRGFLQTGCYHAGMKQEERKLIQDTFMSNKRDGIIVATIAFGMGMDHSSIRYVYHLNLPKSLESYIQEIGRAGRDGQPSTCEVFACIDDVPTLQAFCYAETPSLQSIKQLVNQLFEGKTEGEYVEYSTYQMAYEHDIKDTCLGQMLAQLDISEQAIEESTPFYSEVVCRMQTTPPIGSEAYKVYAEGKIGRTNITFDVQKIGQQLDMEYGRISRTIDDMVNDGYLATARAHKMMHRALIKKSVHDLDALARRLHAGRVKTEQRQLQRLLKVVEYVSAKECQSATIQKHLGDQLSKSGLCQHCEFCLNKSSKLSGLADDVRTRQMRKLDERRWALVLNEDKLPRDNPLLLARFAAGISSPVISRHFRRLSTFGSMADHDFPVLLQAAQKECISAPAT